MGAWYMNDDGLALLKESALRLVRDCIDGDLLDLICKLLLESGTAVENGDTNVGIIP
jgi:hypothetical protein